jgi:PAS domain S-box-containing protein
MHPTLARQLNRHKLGPGEAPDAGSWASFLALVDKAYEASDEDRYLLERSTSLASAEMAVLHGELTHQRDRLEQVVQALDDGVIVFDEDLMVEHFNPEALRMVGITADALTEGGMRGLARLPGLDQRVRQVLEQLIEYETSRSGYQRLDDVTSMAVSGEEALSLSMSFIPVVENQKLQSVVITIRDLTELKHYESELNQAQKLEAVGRLAAGIAHEINTPMQFVSDNLRFFQDAFYAMKNVLDVADALTAKVDEERPEDWAVRSFRDAKRTNDVDFFRAEIDTALSQTIDGIERVSSIVRAMKNFAHPGSDKPSPTDLNSAIESVLVVARNEIKYVANVETEFGEIPLVPCLIGDINQVFLNLFVNAAHAIAERVAGSHDRGKIVVRTYTDDDSVVVEIEDTGTGIPPDIAKRIFDPFFTTKDIGKGTGQGLALARNVITKRHGGTLTFKTALGVGTTFTIRLPLSAQDQTSGGLESSTD